MLETLLQDARYALRLIRKNPLFSVVTILILALGIGSKRGHLFGSQRDAAAPVAVRAGRTACTLLLGRQKSCRSACRSPRRNLFSGGKITAASIPSARMTWFAIAAQISPSAARLQFVHLLSVTQDFFPTLGVEPRFGRNFTAEECKPGGPRAAMLTYGLWQSRFGGDTGIVGRAVDIDGNSVTVVGVLPQSFEFATDADVWVPLRLEFNPADGARQLPDARAAAVRRNA